MLIWFQLISHPARVNVDNYISAIQFRPDPLMGVLFFVDMLIWYPEDSQAKRGSARVTRAGWGSKAFRKTFGRNRGNFVT